MTNTETQGRPSQEFVARLISAVRSWQGTPYVAGCCQPGQGVDCRYFAVAVYDELAGVSLTRPPRRPVWAGVWNPRDAMKDVLAIQARYPVDRLRPSDGYGVRDVEPGDALVTGPASDTPGHVMLAGAEPGELWHAAPSVGVCRIALGPAWRVVSWVWRLQDRR